MEKFDKLPDDFSLESILAPAQQAPAPSPQYEPLPQNFKLPGSPEEPTSTLGYAKDLGGAFVAGAARGAVSLPGIVGDIGQLYERSPAYASWVSNRISELRGTEKEGAARRAYEAAMKPIEARMTPEERAGMEYRIAGVPFPTGQKVVKKVAGLVPQIEYEGQSPEARILGTVGEFVGQVPGTSFVSGGVRAALGAPKAAGIGTRATRELSTATGAGATSGAAGEYMRGTDDEAAARVLSAVPGALTGRAIAGRLPGAATERGQRIAGDIIRKTDEGVATKPIPADLSENVAPTSGQVFGSQMGALEAAVNPAESAAQRARSTAAMGESAAKLPGEVQAGGVGVGSPSVGPGISDLYANPLAMSSEAAQKLYLAIQEPAKAAYDAAWEHPALKQARYNKNAVNKALDAADKQMSSARVTMPLTLGNLTNALRNNKNPQIPFADLQRAKAEANSIIRDPLKTPSEKDAAIAISTKLDDLMTDTKSVSKIFMKGVIPSEVGPAFDKARTLAREYKTTFETPVTRPLSEVHDRYHAEVGKPVIQPEEFLSKILKTPDQALAKYRELQGIPNLDISRPVSDWLVSQIQGGKAFITPDMIANARKSPSYDTLIREVPGLEQRLNLIANTTKADQIAMSLNDAIQRDPTKLAAWIRDNRADLNANLKSPESRMFLDSLNRSANILKKTNLREEIPEQAAKNLNMLSNGDLFTLLHGRTLGIGGGLGAGYLAGTAAGFTIPAQISMDLIGAGLGAAGAGAAGSKYLSGPAKFAARIIYGTTQQDAMAALQRAAIDPQFAKFLAQKPTEANAMKLRGLLRETAASGAASGVAATRLPDQPPEAEKTIEEQWRELTIRPQRASGGRAGGMTADMLIAAAERAKKAIGKDTEALLSTPDASVAKALAVANQKLEG